MTLCPFRFSFDLAVCIRDDCLAYSERTELDITSKYFSTKTIGFCSLLNKQVYEKKDPVT